MVKRTSYANFQLQNFQQSNVVLRTFECELSKVSHTKRECCMYLRVCKIVYLSWLIWYYATFYTYMRILSNTIRFTYIYFKVKMRFLWSYDWTNTHVIQLVSSGKPRTINLFTTCYSTRIFSIYTYQVISPNEFSADIGYTLSKL